MHLQCRVDLKLDSTAADHSSTGVLQLTSIYQASGLLCLSCGKTSWESNTETLRCLSCESVYAIENGVVRLHVPDENDDVTRLYTAIDGTHFLSASFES